MAHVKKGDTVTVIAGNDKGANGEVLEVIGERALVSGVRLVKKHQKAIPGQGGQEGGIITTEAPIHLSNLKRTEKKAPKKAAKKGTK
jgi:large subunit ribosomal protein L24